ncbi:MAG: hypothetical protein MZV64_71610 [Ignavibacteriales bacterium]|nr:hypothetical protein [Ignavibacteriales bacterium]
MPLPKLEGDKVAEGHAVFVRRTENSPPLKTSASFGHLPSRGSASLNGVD